MPQKMKKLTLILKKLMQNVTDYLETLRKSKKSQNAELSAIDISEIYPLLNNTSNRHASGKLAEYKKLLNTCKFKMTAYFNQDVWNRPYTIDEKIAKKHRRFIPSNDRVRNITNEETGLNTLIDYCLQKADRLDSAQIRLIDRLNGEEHLIFKFNPKIIAASDFAECEFKTNEYGHTYFKSFIDQPFQTDKIRS